MAQEGYGSAADLPTAQKLRRELRGARTLTRFVARGQRSGVIEMEQRLEHMTATIDRFYDRLGARHWIFHDMLHLEEVASLVTADVETDDLEQRFITEQYAPDRLGFMIGRLRSIPALNVRMNQLRTAQADYLAGRYYGVVLLLLCVMDGFVGDSDPSDRKNLHARTESELFAWDSAVGHHQGLQATQATFTKPFKRVVEEPVTELYRNGIVHGYVLDFNNIVVATKAWNRLFALSDWAQATQRQSEPAKPTLSFSEFLGQAADDGRVHMRLRAWKPHTLRAFDSAFADDLLTQTITAFLDAWQNKRWAQMVPALPLRDQERHGKGIAKHVRDLYEWTELARYTITELRFFAAAGAECHAIVDFGDLGSFRSVSRWVFEAPDRRVVIPPDDAGCWTVAHTGPTHFIRDGDDAADTAG